MSRVNARLPEDTQAQLRYLTEATGHSVSHVLRESVAHYYAHVKRQQPGSRLVALAGRWTSGHADTSERVKALVGDDVDDKWGAAQAAPARRR